MLLYDEETESYRGTTFKSKSKAYVLSNILYCLSQSSLNLTLANLHVPCYLTSYKEYTWLIIYPELWKFFNTQISLTCYYFLFL